MALRLAGKTAVITGAASGIAKATATLFASQGCRLVLADRDADRGADVAKLIAAEHGTECEFVACDVSSAVDVQKAVSAAADMGLGQIDALVNVAGVDIIATLAQTDEARWRRTLDVNLTSIYLTCHAALPHLQAAGRSAIVNGVLLLVLVLLLLLLTSSSTQSQASRAAAASRPTPRTPRPKARASRSRGSSPWSTRLRGSA